VLGAFIQLTTDKARMPLRGDMDQHGFYGRHGLRAFCAILQGSDGFAVDGTFITNRAVWQMT